MDLQVGVLGFGFVRTGPQESVSRYIEENMQLLLSLALDHWFAHTNITYTGKEQLVADETLIAYRDKIRDELRVRRLCIPLYLLHACYVFACECAYW